MYIYIILSIIIHTVYIIVCIYILYYIILYYIILIYYGSASTANLTLICCFAPKEAALRGRGHDAPNG